MSPNIHADLSAQRFGGKPQDYLEIHEFLDSSKAAVSDVRHRTPTHNSWFVTNVMERVFGSAIKNSDNDNVSVREIAQRHVMEDLGGSYPTAQDYLVNLKFQTWMNNGQDGSVPPSHEGLPAFDQSLLNPKETKKNQKDKIKVPTPQKQPRSFFDSIRDDGPARGCGGGGRID